mmetsp:Transcript_39618/g.55020  ORF Transcript_39618/g.55020 Transcript_39618/m.55020 type:complete len:469 (+) Transcript_39618:234-1640(+)|eukprot:CAMPEP_0196594946 /NCGR_PEP_ID=MMETSP1081-20130531/79750_1 /TAXON_ID=36882 /ORGANISM="Pyramimonas amylifera, Strain CCMP720" /LENGTH=468 /DNA_ID=CAMNT_0041919365 /DNA_START=223 /DNA_END=1629 /DNA_ORIENTATION=-
MDADYTHQPDLQMNALTPSQVYSSFVVMAACFSLNHACVTTVLSLASTELGPQLGGLSSGLLFLGYTLTALLLSTALVAAMGQKSALASGTAAYCLYVSVFLVAIFWEEAKWPAAIVGSLIGGGAAGWLWTAQGGYMTSSVEAYVAAQLADPVHLDTNSLPDSRPREEQEDPLLGNRVPASTAPRTGPLKERASSKFASVFSLIYLAAELALKGASWGILRLPGGRPVCFAMFTTVAVVSSAGMLWIRDVEKHLNSSRSTPRAAPSFSRALEALQLLRSDVKMLLMYPTQMAFGFTSSFLTYYVTKDIVNKYFDEATIPLLASVISGTAAILSLPAGWAATRLGKLPVVGAGLACFILVTLTFMLAEPQTLGRWSVMVPLYVIYGYGRCTFEGQNKAVMADFFPQHGAAWGANVIISSGGASALGFILFPIMTKTQMALVCLVVSCLALVCYTIANAIHYKEKQHGGK